MDGRRGRRRDRLDARDAEPQRRVAEGARHLRVLDAGAVLNKNRHRDQHAPAPRANRSGCLLGFVVEEGLC